MSVNKRNPETGELVVLASGARMWVGTKLAHDAAIAAGTMPNNCMVCLTDDYGDATVDAVTVGDMHPITSNAVATGTVIKKNVTLSATSSIEDDIKSLLDILIIERGGTYSGAFTRTGSTSGNYTVSVSQDWNVTGTVSICGAATKAYSVAKFKNTVEGEYTYKVRELTSEYSTNEVLTGQTWINGKPIYRKVLIVEQTITSEATIPSTIPEDAEDYWIDFGKSYFIASETDARLPLSYAHPLGLTYQITAFLGTKDSIYVRVGSTQGVRKMVAILEYTKTTD